MVVSAGLRGLPELAPQVEASGEEFTDVTRGLQLACQLR